MARLRALFVLAGSGGLFLFDRCLKYLAINDWEKSARAERIFDWRPYANHGIGFGLPVPNAITIGLTAAILALVVFLAYKKAFGAKRDWPGVFCLSLIFFGAVSNLIDRIFFGYAVDYFFIITGYINLADAMIVAGLFFYWRGERAPEAGS